MSTTAGWQASWAGCLGYHFSYTLWLASALGLAGFVRSRGSWIANIAWVLAILGISTIPGFLFADFLDAAMGQIVGVDDAVRVGELAQRQWAFTVMAVPGLAGLLLALPLGAVAAWWAGLLAWWGAAAVVAGKAAFIGFGATLPGNLLLTVTFVIFAVALARIDPRAWYSSPMRPAEAPRPHEPPGLPRAASDDARPPHDEAGAPRRCPAAGGQVGSCGPEMM